jgi:hypothetical protein
LVAGEPNVSYICSRYYRAPELIFGATNYTTNIGEFRISEVEKLFEADQISFGTPQISGQPVVSWPN